MESTKRFSDRVADYARYRPGYPDEAIGYILDSGKERTLSLCDAGSGTGILTSLLLAKGVEVFALEPNDEMRGYAESVLGKEPRFHSVAAPAERTTLPDSSLDLITAAQSFHWFDREACKLEFTRILKPGGLVFLIWNRRVRDSSFMQDYDQLLKGHCPDYTTANHQKITDDEIQDFLGNGYDKASFPNSQRFSLGGFLGRVFSSSYTPAPTQSGYKAFKSALEGLFRQYQQDGTVEFIYSTDVYSGMMGR